MVKLASRDRYIDLNELLKNHSDWVVKLAAARTACLMLQLDPFAADAHFPRLLEVVEQGLAVPNLAVPSLLPSLYRLRKHKLFFAQLRRWVQVPWLAPWLLPHYPKFYRDRALSLAQLVAHLSEIWSLPLCHTAACQLAFSRCVVSLLAEPFRDKEPEADRNAFLELALAVCQIRRAGCLETRAWLRDYPELPELVSCVAARLPRPLLEQAIAHLCSPSLDWVSADQLKAWTTGIQTLLEHSALRSVCLANLAPDLLWNLPGLGARQYCQRLLELTAELTTEPDFLAAWARAAVRQGGNARFSEACHNPLFVLLARGHRLPSDLDLQSLARLYCHSPHLLRPLQWARPFVPQLLLDDEWPAPERSAHVTLAIQCLECVDQSHQDYSQVRNELVPALLRLLYASSPTAQLNSALFLIAKFFPDLIDLAALRPYIAASFPDPPACAAYLYLASLEEESGFPRLLYLVSCALFAFSFSL